MNDLISEFFYDGIRRIIPGVVVIALYFHHEVVSVLRAYHDISVVIVSVCLLMVAWVLGFVIEEIMSFVAHIFWKYGGEWCFWAVHALLFKRKKQGEAGLNGKNSIRQWFLQHKKDAKTADQNSEQRLASMTDKSLKRDIRRLKCLTFAEREMSRSLFGIFLVACCVAPKPFSVFPWKDYFEYFIYLGAGVFLFSWLWGDLKDRPLNDAKKAS